LEKALLDGQVVYASQIAKNDMTEKNIRLLSREKKLRCTDPGCKKPLVRYCHGEVNFWRPGGNTNFRPLMREIYFCFTLRKFGK